MTASLSKDSGRFSSATRPVRGRSALRSRLASLSRRLTILAIGLLFAVSTMLLYQFGYNYEVTGGSFLEKMHPGSLVAMAAFGALTLSRPSPFRFVADLLASRLGVATFLGCCSLLIVYLALVQKSPFTAVIDTFLMPMILFLLLDRQRQELAPTLEPMLHAFMAINSLLGLFEVVSGWRLVPYTTAGFEITDDWRATAIMGHPLANALATGCYLLILLLRGGARLEGTTRFVVLSLTCAGMVAFGGRAAMVLLLVFAAPLMALRTLHALAFARLTPQRAAILTLGAICVVGGLGVLTEAGAFDRFIGRFVDDQGSAKSRVAMFELFDGMPWRDLLIGPDPALIETLKQIEGLEFGIESFWVSSALAYGLIMSTILFVGLFLFCRDLVRATGVSTWWLLGYFFAVASTSVSLSAKTCILGMIVALAMVLLPPGASARFTAKPR